LLQQSVMPHDEIIFDEKQSLLKDGSLVLQEKLLLFADDELPPEERTQLFNLLATDKAAAAEWKILQQTKLQPDESIVFEDKRSLYRTEGGRVIGFKWWRVAAAALLLGFGIWLGANVFRTDKKNSGNETETIANGKTNQPPQNTNTQNPAQIQLPEKEDSTSQTAKIITPQKSQEQNQPGNNNLVKTNEKNTPGKGKPIKQNDLKLKSNDNNIVKEDVPNKKPGNNLPTPDLEKVNNATGNKNDAVIVQPKTADNNLPRVAESKTELVTNNGNKTVEAVKNPDVNNNASANNLAKNTVFNETDENKGDTRILYMDEDKVKRTKIGGMLRRLKRVVERTTNIKTGNTVKVAGFEIAIK
jgi:hypothetical protein